MPNDDLILPPPPPPGQDHSASDEGRLVEYIDGLMMECYERRREYDEQADRNENLHRGRARLDKPKEGVEALDANRIRNVDIAHVQVQTEQTPRVKFMARETGDVPKVFLDPRVNLGNLQANPALTQLLLQVPAECMQGDAPLPDQIADMVEQAIEDHVLPSEAVILVSERVKAEGEQVVFDEKWAESESDFYVREAAFKKTIIGWQFMSYGFEDEKKIHRLWNPSHLQVFIDPSVTHIRDAAHAELLQFMDLRRAVKLYPKARDKLEASAIPAGSAGASMGSGITSFPFRIPEIYRLTNFRRAMVPVRHCWIRDYAFDEVPMSLDDALAGGHIVAAQEQTAPPVNDEEGNEIAPATMSTVHRMPTDPVTGATVDTGVPRNSAGWPVHRAESTGIREICMVGNTCIYDRESQFGDIPLPHMVDLPIIDSPFGEGQPEALECLQLALNNLLSDISTYFHYIGTPPMVIAASAAAKLPGFAAGVYSAPHGFMWEIPDDLIHKFGDIKKIVSFLDVPGIPPDFWRFLDMLLSLIDKEGQVTEALSGEGKPDWSGDMVARLQNAARGLIAWKSLRMEDSLKYLANLMLHSQRTRMTPEDCAAICSKYPIGVWREIYRTPPQVTINVEIVSGSGQLGEQAKGEAMQLYNNGTGPLSATSLLETFGKDPKVEEQNKLSEADRRLSAMQAMPAVPAGAAPAMPAGAPVQAPQVIAA